MFEIYNEYACLSNYLHFLGIEDIFDDELFLYTIESGIDVHYFSNISMFLGLSLIVLHKKGGPKRQTRVT